MKKSILALLLAVLMVASLLPAAAMADGPDGTVNNPFTTVAEYNNAVKDVDTWDGEDIYLTIENETFGAGAFNLTNVQSRVNPPKLHLTLKKCTFNGNTSGDGDMTKPVGQRGNTSFMYLSNCQELYIDGCTFNTGNDSLKYGINWNLIQITNATVEIKNSTFTGTYEENAIKLNQRNGDDDKAKDIKYDSWNGNIIAASIESALIENVKINSDVAVILLGSAAKGTEGAAAPSTGAFPVTIKNVSSTGENGKVFVFEAYLADEDIEAAAENALKNGDLSAVADYVKAMTAGETLSKTASGDLAGDDSFVAEVNGEKFTKLGDAITFVRQTGGVINLLKDADLGTTGAPMYVITGGVEIRGNHKVTVGVDRGRSFMVYGSLTLDGVEMVFNKVDATEGSDTSTAFCLENGSDTVEPGVLNIINGARVVINGLSRGFVFESEGDKGSVKAKVNVENSSVVSDDISGNFSNGGIWHVKSGSDLSVSNVGYHGLSCDGLYVDNSTIDVSNCGYRGISINTGGEELSITNGSVVNITNCATASSYPIQLGMDGNPVSILVSSNSSLNLTSNGANGMLNTINMPAGGDIDVEGKVNADFEYPQNNDSYVVKVVIISGEEIVKTVPVSEPYFALPAAPSMSGYAFLGWSDGVATYDALKTVTITRDTTFTAVWVRHPDTPYVPEPEQPEQPETPTFPFYDVSSSAWYYSAVKYVYENKLMDGVDTYVFAPNDTLTRAMVWTIIARMSGVDTTGGNSWYAKAQEWVITNGISDGENPTAAITRQELVTMLYRYAQIKGYDVSVGENTNILSYVDATSISEYAVAAFQWACGSGLTEGDENGALTPLATATRAQAAAMIMRFLSK